jgi:hypothetical protein
LLTCVKLSAKSRLASFDVIALYPSIPMERALQVVEEKLRNDVTLPDRTEWNVDQIMKLVHISLETYFKTLGGDIFKQTDGTPIGKSISGPIAGIYMAWLEETFILNGRMKRKISFWKRMRDDIFLVWEDTSERLQSFQVFLNGIEPKIQFTLEEEKDGNLAFLDMFIMRREGKLATKVYRKPTHTQQYIHWRSNHAKNTLLGVLKGLIHRAHMLTDEMDDLKEELQLLNDVFISNGYPVKLVQETIKKSWEVETLKNTRIATLDDNGNPVEKSEFYDVLQAPYVQGFSEMLQKKLKKLNVGFVPKIGTTIRSLVCKPKDKTPKEKIKNVVYKIPCQTCGMLYIGETSQRIEERKKQHMLDVDNRNSENGIFDHLKETKEHSIAWENMEVVTKESDWCRRKIAESLCINTLNPGMELTQVMNIEKGKKIDSRWIGFNDFFKKEFHF